MCKPKNMKTPMVLDNCFFTDSVQTPLGAHEF